MLSPLRKKIGQEFETLPKADRTPIPMRMLDRYTRLKRLYDRRIYQAVICSIAQTRAPSD